MRPKTISSAGGRALLFAALVFALAGVSLSQDTVLEGLVTDRDGQPLKDAKIIFVDREGGQKFTAKSDKKGQFMRVGMPTGHYLVRAELEGYLPLETDYVLNFDSKEKLKLTLDKVPPRINEDADLAEGTRLFQQGKFKESLSFFQQAVEKSAGVWQAGHMLAGGRYSLFGCTVAPGFTGDIFEGGTREALLQLYSDRAEDINQLSVSKETSMPDGFAT